MDQSEGRITRGMRLLRESWGFLRERPRLTVLPIVSTILTSVVALGIGFPVYLAVHHSLDHQASLFVALAAGMWPATVLGTFLGVAFLAMVMDDLEGREARVGAGLAFARRLVPAIIGWSLLATGVGLLLSALQQLPGVGGWLGRLIGFAGGLAWQLAAFFVLPVLVLEGTGPIESVKRSAHAFRERWGETVTAGRRRRCGRDVRADPGRDACSRSATGSPTTATRQPAWR